MCSCFTKLYLLSYLAAVVINIHCVTQHCTNYTSLRHCQGSTEIRWDTQIYAEGRLSCLMRQTHTHLRARTNPIYLNSVLDSSKTTARKNCFGLCELIIFTTLKELPAFFFCLQLLKTFLKSLETLKDLLTIKLTFSKWAHYSVYHQALF